jgi:uncharacterized membrane protein (DUF2068 family)
MAGTYGAPPPTGQRSGGVTAVAIVNFVLGGLAILCGLLGFLGGAVLSSAGSLSKEMEADMRKKGMEVKSGDLQSAGTKAMFLSVVNLGWGVAAIVSGIGLIGRKQWGKLIALVLGAIAVLLALFALYQMFAESFMSILSVLIYGGYAATVFLILLKPEVKAEFS